MAYRCMHGHHGSVHSECFCAVDTSDMQWLGNLAGDCVLLMPTQQATACAVAGPPVCTAGLCREHASVALPGAATGPD